LILNEGQTNTFITRHGWPGKRIDLGILFSSARICWTGLALAVFLASGCGHHKHTQQPPPEAQAPSAPEERAPEERAKPARPDRIAPTPAPPGGVSEDDLEYVAHHRPILSEVGFATWYTAARGRRAANGQVFDDHALTAAHRTLPMGSLVKVTNLKTGQSSAMRITDRGPFVDGRFLDLTIASARATGIYRAGLVRVRLDVYRAPKPIDTGGRWCVQIGAFKEERIALKLKRQLLRKYPDANVIEFPGENSYWVRIRPAGDDREEAEHIANHLKTAEGEAYLTRLD
jgi:rare lipoprotein A